MRSPTNTRNDYAASLAHGTLPYHPALDGVRAAAVSIVLFFHSGFEWAPGAFLGISTFFTLSGFLITGILVSEYERTGRIGVVSFWGRRIRRLMPAALITLLLVSFYAVFVAEPAELAQLRGDVLAALFYVANWHFWITGQSYLRILSEPSLVQHLWSLSVEEQFYLLFPLIAFATLRRSQGSRTALAAVLMALVIGSSLLSVSFYQDGAGFGRVYYGTDARAAELLIGALLALWCTGKGQLESRISLWVTNTMGLACMVAVGWLWAVTDLGEDWFFEGGALGYSLLSAGILYAAIQPGPVRSTLSVRPLRWIGRISYGLYVYHWPIFLWLDPPTTGLDGWPLFLLRLGVTFPAAALSYRLIELPIRARRFGWREREGLVLVATIALVLVVTLLATKGSRLPEFETDEIAIEEQTLESKYAKSSPRVMVVGDSLARNIGRGLVLHNRDRNEPILKIFNRAKRMCNVAKRSSIRMADGSIVKLGPGCTKAWPELVEEIRPDFVVVLAGVWDLLVRQVGDSQEFIGPRDLEFDTILMSEYESAVDVLSARGAKVLWLTFPCATQEHYPALINLDDALSDENIGYLNEVILPRLAQKKRGRLELLPFFDLICPDGVFRSGVGPIENARHDGLHFTEPAMRWIARWLEAQIVRELGTQKPDDGVEG